MNRIKVSTIKMTADCEVINVSSRLISKAIKAKLVVDHIENYAHWCDEGGQIHYTEAPKEEVENLMEVVKPFLDELYDAFEAE